LKKGYFITATDTGVGKTTFTVALAKALGTRKEKPLNVGVFKPIETGCTEKNGRIIPEDTLKLKEAIKSKESFDLLNTYRFSEPVAPLLAARTHGVNIDFENIKTCFNEIAGKRDMVLVEGAGGLLVPLNDKETIADLILYLGLPAIIIAPSRLGCINHTLLTLRHAKQLGIKIKGVVLNRPDERVDESQKTNASLLKELGVPIIGELPFIYKGELSKIIAKHINLNIF
jgi:dethiobiotin synthetase